MQRRHPQIRKSQSHEVGAWEGALQQCPSPFLFPSACQVFLCWLVSDLHTVLCGWTSCFAPVVLPLSQRDLRRCLGLHSTFRHNVFIAFRSFRCSMKKDFVSFKLTFWQFHVMPHVFEVVVVFFSGVFIYWLVVFPFSPLHVIQDICLVYPVTPFLVTFSQK